VCGPGKLLSRDCDHRGVLLSPSGRGAGRRAGHPRPVAFQRCPAAVTHRIPSLDGLRAIAITFVLAAHAAHRGAAWLPPLPTTYLNVLALTGVKIFFVLSGFLITSLLLKEFG